MTLEELITKCLIGEEHLEQAEYEQIGNLLIELKTLRKAYELIANELAVKNNCSSIRECSSCYVNDECHDSKWLMEYYKVIAVNGG